MATTRLTLDALMGRPAGSFAGKPESTDGPHPVGILTRMDMMGLYTQRAGSFAGKAATVAEEPLRLFPILGVGL
jgi:hypothetical protein